MVYKSKRKVRPTRRTFKRRARRGYRRKPTRNLTSAVAGLGFPKRMVMTHRYCENVVLNSVSGTLAVGNFSCNALYRPNITVPAGSVMNFDQMAQLYDQYTVIGSKIRVRVATNSPTYSQIFGIMVNDDTNVAYTNISGVDENPLGTTRLIAAGQNPSISLTKRWSAKKMFPGSTLANNDLQGTSTTRPTEQSFYTLFLQDPSATVSVAVTCQVEITYIAVWTELRDVARST